MQTEAVKPSPGFGPDFLKFWAGQTISNLGSSFTAFALPLLVYKLTGSALDLAITTASTFLPYALFGLFIGALVDRSDRRRMMIITDILRALVIAAIPLVAALGWLAVGWIYLISFLISVLTIFFNAGEFTAVPSLVGPEQLVAANGRIQASYSAAGIAGPILAGVLVAIAPLETVLYVDAASFLISALSLWLIRASFGGGQTAGSSLLAEVGVGLRYMLRNPVLRDLCIMVALFNLVGSTIGAQLVYFAKRQLGANDSQWAFFAAAGGVGVIILSLLAGSLRQRLPFSKVALGALTLYSLLNIGFAFTAAYWPALLIWSLMSGLGVLFNINVISLFQAMVPQELMGRIMSVATTLVWSAIPIGSFIGGYFIEVSGNIALVFAVIGVASLLIAVGFAFTSLGHAEDYLPTEAKAGQGKAQPLLVEEAASEAEELFVNR